MSVWFFLLMGLQGCIFVLTAKGSQSPIARPPPEPDSNQCDINAIGGLAFHVFQTAFSSGSLLCCTTFNQSRHGPSAQTYQRELASPAIGLSPCFGLSWFTQYQTQPSFAGLCLYCVGILQTCLWHCFPPLLGTFGLHPVVVLGSSGYTTVCLICTDCFAASFIYLGYILALCLWLEVICCCGGHHNTLPGWLPYKLVWVLCLYTCP
jgi:hypothetical protein